MGQLSGTAECNRSARLVCSSPPWARGSFRLGAASHMPTGHPTPMLSITSPTRCSLSSGAGAGRGTWRRSAVWARAAWWGRLPSRCASRSYYGSYTGRCGLHLTVAALQALLNGTPSSAQHRPYRTYVAAAGAPWDRRWPLRNQRAATAGAGADRHVAPPPASRIRAGCGLLWSCGLSLRLPRPREGDAQHAVK